MRDSKAGETERQEFNAHVKDLGYALLLKKYVDNPIQASESQIEQAAADTIPRVAPMFWTFRVMVAIGSFLMLLMFYGLYAARKGTAWHNKWLLRAALWAIPLPFIGVEVGWFVAEFGRQPWTVYGVLPTHLSTSSLHVSDVQNSLIAFVIMYTLMFAVELYLMFKYARLGPSALHSGRYHFEKGVA